MFCESIYIFCAKPIAELGAKHGIDMRQTQSVSVKANESVFRGKLHTPMLYALTEHGSRSEFNV
jgi:hypothetical protein